MLSSPEKASSHRSLSSPDRMWQDTLGCRREGNGLPQAPCIPRAAARACMSSFFKVGSLKSRHSSPPGKKKELKLEEICQSAKGHQLVRDRVACLPSTPTFFPLHKDPSESTLLPGEATAVSLATQR